MRSTAGPRVPGVRGVGGQRRLDRRHAAPAGRGASGCVVVDHVPSGDAARAGPRPLRLAAVPGLLVVDKVNGGKADALNAGLNRTRRTVFCADRRRHADRARRAAARWSGRSWSTPDDVAAGGTIRIANGSLVEGGRVVVARPPREPAAGFQVVEYLRAFLFGRLGWNGWAATDHLRRLRPVPPRGHGRGRRLRARHRGRGHGAGVRLHRLLPRAEAAARDRLRPRPGGWTEAPESAACWAASATAGTAGCSDLGATAVMFNPRYGAMGLVGSRTSCSSSCSARWSRSPVLAYGVVGRALGRVCPPFAAFSVRPRFSFGRAGCRSPDRAARVRAVPGLARSGRPRSPPGRELRLPPVAGDRAQEGAVDRAAPRHRLG